MARSKTRRWRRNHATSAPSDGWPKRASGGPVQPGLAYVVGERGPELFSPSAAGTIIPNGAAMGGSGVTINFNGPVSNGRQVRLAASQAAARLARAAGAGRRSL
ncbi:MAG: hypothetical protein KGZ61_12195 [Sandarakinorhabdus sp.]|nr:hypothetical protein [Sandarakinorhabdus sp.]